jgi:hypothetical protein
MPAHQQQKKMTKIRKKEVKVEEILILILINKAKIKRQMMVNLGQKLISPNQIKKLIQKTPIKMETKK